MVLSICASPSRPVITPEFMRHQHPRQPVLNQMAAKPLTISRFNIDYSSYSYHEPRNISNTPYFSVHETYSFLKTLVTAMNFLYLCLRPLRYLYLSFLAKFCETCLVLHHRVLSRTLTSLAVITGHDGHALLNLACS